MSIELMVYPDLCHGCGNCVVSCPINALNSPEVAGGKGITDDAIMVMIVEDGAVNLKNSDLCGKCGTCVEMCPVFAISLEETEEA
jgi:4Fe-4S ferredoxin